MKILSKLIIFTLIYSACGWNTQAFAAASAAEDDSGAGRLKRTAALEEIDWDDLWEKNVQENEISKSEQQHLDRQMIRIEGQITLDPEQRFRILAQLSNMPTDMREGVVNKLVEEGVHSYPELYKKILRSW